VIRARNERRREGLVVLVRRIVGPSQPETGALDEVVNMLYTLTSFECFETLAGPARSLEEVAPQVIRLARAALDLDVVG